MNIINVPCAEHNGKRITKNHLEMEHNKKLTIDIIKLLEDGYVLKGKMKVNRENNIEREIPNILEIIKNHTSIQREEFEWLLGLLKNKRNVNLDRI